MTQPEILRQIAGTLRRVAILSGPRDYVPSDAELAADSRPQIESAEACEAGAEAIERCSLECGEDHFVGSRPNECFACLSERASKLEDAAFHFLTCNFHKHAMTCVSCEAFEAFLRGEEANG